MKRTKRKVFTKKVATWEKGKVSFVGRTEDTGSRIVLFEGVVLQDKGDTCICRMIDRNIYESKEPFEIELIKKSMKLLG